MIDKVVSKEEIESMSLDELKMYVKNNQEFLWDVKVSKNNKASLIKTIEFYLDKINMKNRGYELYPNNYLYSNTNMNNMFSLDGDDRFYLNEGKRCFFKKRYYNKDGKLNFNTMIFFNENKEYFILRIDNKISYDIDFSVGKNEKFRLETYGRHGQLLIFNFIDDCGFYLIEDKRILLINGVVNYYRFYRDNNGDDYIKDDKKHTYEDVLNYINNKEIIDKEDESKPSYLKYGEGLI